MWTRNRWSATKRAFEASLSIKSGHCGITHTDFKTPLWNLVALESDVPNELIKELILHSAEEVIKKLPKKKQAEWREII